MRVAATSGELAGKVALVTGAGKGTGRAIALRLAEEGAAVVLTGRDVPALEETLELLPDHADGHLVVPLDLSRPSSVEACAAAVTERWDRLDVLVNNSGIGGASAPLWEVDEADWLDTLSVNLTGRTGPARRSCPAAEPGEAP